ncbi:Hypothetical protein R9X50_00772100 [Acrodontium crateriforme]|uniref:Major facilitator superfamily (MFS) profile domain-containing protein n=1 Tax=Acrodontium crateriforme TaxID=150365 RepID=A0AAQ3MBL2_9PEZI|nr:Hypothetical protein R9X50_00772100 [Acrodontium crateriforme]
MLGWLTGSASRPPLFLHQRSSHTFIILTVATAIFSDIFVYGIVVPVLPFALTARSGVNPADIQTWISIFLAVYGAALLIASPICGFVADRTESRRLPLVLGLVAQGGATAMLCVGNSIAVLAAGRVLQGVSAAVVWVVGLALIVDTVGGEGVGQAMGYVSLSMSLAILLAPLLGGIVYASAGYYAVFAMAFGLIGLDIIMRLVMIEKKVAVKWLPQVAVDRTAKSQIDPEETARQTTIMNDEAITAATPEETDDNDMDHIPEKTDAPQAESTNLPAPIKPPTSRLPPILHLLASRRVMSFLWCSLIQSSLLTSFDAILPLFVRDTFNWTSLGAGLVFLPLVIVSFAGPVIGYLSDKHGPRWYAAIGFAIGCPPLILLRLVHENTINHKVLLCALLALVGLSLDLALVPLMAEITYAVDAKAKRHPPGYFGKNGAYAQAYSLFNMAWAGGCLVGPLLAGLVNQRAGWKVTTLILGILSLITALPAVVWTGGSIWKDRRRIRQDAEGTATSDGIDA